jgi:intracellular multiplication protein IcmP
MAEQSNWPQITPIISQNLVKEDINKGPWAMAMTPTQFCRAQKLFKEKVGDDGKPAVDVIRADAHQVFMLQLGSLWMGPNALPIHTKALFAIFAACANQDRDSAFKLLKQIDISSGEGKLNFEGVQELLVKHYNSKLVGRVLQKHAYVFTVMAAMLELARTDGVFASSEFLWLKPLDRRLWYILNTVGRQTAVTEIAGIFSHFVAEKKWGGALRTPMVEEAVKGLELAISEVIYEPEEED